MNIEYRWAEIEDTEMLVEIYNASFYDDYIRYGECPGYGKTVENMKQSSRNCPKHIIMKRETVSIFVVCMESV